MLHQLCTNVINLCHRKHTAPTCPLLHALRLICITASRLAWQQETEMQMPGPRAEIYFNKPCDNDKLIIGHFVATFAQFLPTYECVCALRVCVFRDFLLSLSAPPLKCNYYADWQLWQRSLSFNHSLGLLVSLCLSLLIALQAPLSLSPFHPCSACT